MRLKFAFLILLLSFMVHNCTHEPFPAPPPVVNPVDTTQNPVDTSQNGKPCHPDTVYYARDIQPLLTANCAYSGCHDANSAQDGVRLDNYTSVRNSADVRPFDPESSDLYEVITENDPDKRMPPPPNSPLSAAEIALIRLWINQGALNLDCDDCDTSSLSYSGEISAIFSSNCTNCHSGANASANRRLDSYQHVKDAMLNTNLLQRINAESGFNVMPPGGKMPSCNIAKLEAWFNAGMPQ